MLLGKIREKATGWLSYAIVILLTIPFALWGIHQYFGFGEDPVVAQVGDMEVPLSRFLSNYQQRKRDIELERGSAGLPPDHQIKSEVISGLVQGLMMFKVAEDYRYVVPDDVIASIVTDMPEFQKDGRFDRALYRELLTSSQSTENQFETRIRNDLRQRQFRNLIMNSSFVLPSEQEQFERLLFQEREIRYVTLDAKERFYDETTISEQDMATYFEGHRESFIDPERVKISYISLSLKDIEDALDEEIDEETLREFYEANIDRYYTPEKRRVAHIVVDPGVHGEDGARTRADEIYERLNTGEDFVAVAQEMSDDAATAEKGGELPELVYGDWSDTPDLEDLMFETAEGGHTKPWEDRFGVRILKVLEISQSSGQQTFEELREQLDEEIRPDLAQTGFNEKVAEMGQLVFENPSSLEPVANAFGLQPKPLDWMTRSSPTDIFLEYPALVDYAFSPQLTQQKYNSQILEVEPGLVYVMRADDYKPEREFKFNEAKDAVRAEMASITANTTAEDLMRNDMLTELRAGTPLETVAEEHDMTVLLPGFVSRIDANVLPHILDHAFKMPTPSEGEDIPPVYSMLMIRPHTFVVIALSAVKDGKVDVAPPELSMAFNEYEAITRALMKEANVKLFQEHLDDVE